MMAARTAPFRDWVPGWLRAVVGYAILIPIMLINGAYTGSSVDISGALGILSEDINMAYYAASAGMMVAYPLIPKVRAVVNTKTVLLYGLLLQIVLSLVCATTLSIGIIIGTSFLIGFLKAFALLEMIIILKPIFSKNDVRSEFYAYFYPTVFAIGQLSMIITAELAYSYHWQYMYYFVVIMLLIAVLLILICFAYANGRVRIPFENIDGVSVVLISAVSLMMIYVCNYGKVRDWFDSWDIVVCTVAAVPLLWMFVLRQLRSEKPYVNLAVLGSPKAVAGYCFMAMVMVLSASSSLVSIYASSVLRLDSIHANGLNLLLIPGFVVGSAICFWWFRLQVWRFRVLVFWGMACFVAYFGILYFGLMPDGTYEFLFLPMFFKGVGMMILFIAFGVYAVEDMDPKLMISNAFFVVGSRSLIAPVVGSSFFVNYIYRNSQHYISVLSEGIDLQNEVSAARYTESLNAALAQGEPMHQASQMAINTLYSAVNTQALMLTIKGLLGYLLIFSIVVMIISRFIPFHKTLKVKTVRTGDDMA